MKDQYLLEKCCEETWNRAYPERTPWTAMAEEARQEWRRVFDIFAERIATAENLESRIELERLRITVNSLRDSPVSLRHRLVEWLDQENAGGELMQSDIARLPRAEQ
jgi:hypothetical protein